MLPASAWRHIAREKGALVLCKAQKKIYSNAAPEFLIQPLPPNYSITEHIKLMYM